MTEAGETEGLGDPESRGVQPHHRPQQGHPAALHLLSRDIPGPAAWAAQAAFQDLQAAAEQLMSLPGDFGPPWIRRTKAT